MDELPLVSLLNDLGFFTRLMSVCVCMFICAGMRVCVIAIILPYNGACVDIVHKVFHVSVFLW